MLGLSPFVPHCSFSHSYSPVTQLNAILPVFLSLHESLCLSLTHSLSILGFTASIPEGRSIDCNSLSMKSPLCYWRKETSFNRTDNSLPLLLLIVPSLPFYIYTISLTLYFVLGARRMIGRQYRQRSEATAGGLFDDQWGRILRNHPAIGIVNYL